MYTAAVRCCYSCSRRLMYCYTHHTSHITRTCSTTDMTVLSSLAAHHQWLSTAQETQLLLTNRATHLCKRNGVTDLLNMASPHMCYHVKFGSFASKGVRINRREPPQLGSAGARPLARNTSLPCHPAEFGNSTSNGTSVIKIIRQKILTRRVPLFKVTHGHRNRHESISHLRLPINVP